MKTDTYSKVVLTIIAVCLVVLTLQQTNLIPKAYAAEARTPAFADSNLSFDYSGRLRVSVENTPDVNIKNTPNVSIYNTPNVKLYGTPSVKIDNNYIYTKPY